MLAAVLMLVAPDASRASDMMGVAVYFTLPVLAVSLIVAFAVAFAGKGVWAYLTLLALIALNAGPGVALTGELVHHNHDLPAAAFHAIAYLALLAPPYVLHRRLKPPLKAERTLKS